MKGAGEVIFLKGAGPAGLGGGKKGRGSCKETHYMDAEEREGTGVGERATEGSSVASA